jgi:hypothetical protein
LEIVIEKFSNAKYFVFEVCVRIEVKLRIVEVLRPLSRCGGRCRSVEAAVEV